MSTLPKVAYFSMEYGLDTSFKTYAGGLGILAGDYIKGARDFDYPVIGIGIKWKQGYTDQMIVKEGKAYDTYHNYDYDFLEDTGITVSVTIRNREVLCKVYKVDCFGNADLYLLDTDLPENEDAWITGQLYGWFGEERIAQEMVLGIGGIKAIRALNLDIDIYHFNEGHPVFAAFELINEKTEKGLSYKKAVKKTRKEIVFTTHTPIIQGNEEHYIDRLMYMGANNGLSKKHLIEFGGKPFNMTVAALRLSKMSNAVAQLHKETANDMWKHIDNRSNILGITNAIHKPTWVDQRLSDDIKSNEIDLLWHHHMENKKALIDFIAKRNNVKLDPEKLLIGFSRRAAPYKRSDLIFTSPEIIEPLLKGQKLQIVFSGKAHPLDDVGKEIVQNLVTMSRKYPNSVVFLENYDMTIGANLTRGSDVWLNNPRRPKEASGTSGMKAAMNGVLNLSTLDGWWPEACEHGINGWSFGDAKTAEDFDGDLHAFDAHDVKALYKVLLEEVIPTYYDNRKKWIEMMISSIKSTEVFFDVKRMLEEYYELLYKA
jgi:starch phosphorylase